MKQNAMLFLDLRRVKQEYPISRRKAQQLIKEKRLKAFRLDGKIIVKRSDLEREHFIRSFAQNLCGTIT
jgi:hypothetical protein